jgi:hypothetical protein
LAIKVNAKRIKIAVEDDEGKYRSLTKIVPYPDGGFAVLAPYHAAKEGYLFKIAIPEELRGRFDTPHPAEIHRYSAADRVKLSFHPDGFVQFSSENPSTIRSGRDERGEPKGLGILRPPLSEPIVSGPTFGLVAWGLSDFAECLYSERNVVRFSQADLYYGRGSTPMSEPKGIGIDGIVFPSIFWEAVRGEPPNQRLKMAFRELVSGFATVDVRVVSLENSNVFIGLFLSRFDIEFRSASGFELCSPGDKAHFRMFAIYPKPEDVLIRQTLDFASPESKNEAT